MKIAQGLGRAALSAAKDHAERLVWYGGPAEVARRLSPKVVLLFAGAAEPRGHFHMTMGSEDALEAANASSDAALVTFHNEGRSTCGEARRLAGVFAKFGKAERLVSIEKGQRLLLPASPETLHHDLRPCPSGRTVASGA